MDAPRAYHDLSLTYSGFDSALGALLGVVVTYTTYVDGEYAGSFRGGKSGKFQGFKWPGGNEPAN